MKKYRTGKLEKIIIALLVIGAVYILKDFNKVEAAQYQYTWPIIGDNATETYRDYRYYGSNRTGPTEDGKYGREYVVDNTKWPEEQSYYAKSESHFGMDITGIYGHTYQVASIVEGTVIATSADRIYNPSANYIERNQRRTQGGIIDGGGYGNYIIIEENGTGRCFLYAHLKGGSFKVSRGSKVSVGTHIATMGSSGDSGHMHLHFEIRKNRASIIWENTYERHALVSTTEATAFDPAQYIGEGIRREFKDERILKIPDEECKVYVKYLYRMLLRREAGDSEVQFWVNRYKETGSIAEITGGVVLSSEANLSGLSNLDFSRKCYEIVLMRTTYTDEEMSGHVDKLNSGIWTRRDYINVLSNSKEFITETFPTIQCVYNACEDKKIVELSDNECGMYIKYLYNKALGRNAGDNEVQFWVNIYKQTNSISEVTKGIVLSYEANLSGLNNLEFSRKCYEIILMRKSYTDEEMSGHANRMNSGIWTRTEYIDMLCNSEEFTTERIPEFLKSSSGVMLNLIRGEYFSNYVKIM